VRCFAAKFVCLAALLVAVSAELSSAVPPAAASSRHSLAALDAGILGAAPGMYVGVPVTVITADFGGRVARPRPG
jgi:hypothetical protein